MTKDSSSAFRLDPNTIVLVFVLPLLSGAAALSHELLWTRRLVDILGATDWVVGRVLGLFFLGISIGAYLATYQVRWKAPAIKQLMMAELGVGLLALPAVFLPVWTEWIWAALGTEALVSWQGALIKVLLGVIVVLPPSVAMGLTLPMFIRAATDRGSDVSTVGILVYAINTFGGVLGLWVTSTWLIQWCGAQNTMMVVVLINGTIALTLATIAQLDPSQGRIRQTAKHRSTTNHEDSLIEKYNESPEVGDSGGQRNESPSFSGLSLLLLSFVSGFVVLSLEVLLLRLIYLVVPSSFHSTSAMLANVILLLAIGSAVISAMGMGRLGRKLVGGRWFLATCFVVAAVCISVCPLILYEMTDKLMSIRYLEGLNGRTINSIGKYWSLVFWLVAMTGGLALLFCGFVFPTLMRQSSNMDPTGKKVGLLLAANGIGGLLGGEFSNLYLIEWVGVYQSFAWLAGGVLICGASLMLRSSRTLAIAGTLGVAVVVYVAHKRCDGLPYISPRSKTKFTVTETVFGREGVLLVVENSEGSKSILVNGQYVLGSSGATADQRRQLMLPWLLHPSARKVCSLGLATGISAGGLESLNDPPELLAVELSENVERLARTYFSNEANGFFDRSENRVVIEDARTYMAAAQDEFDLIVGDLYRPHGSGEGRLFTVEHFRNVRTALADDGLYCQWLPIYQLNFQNWKTIAATFQQVFPETLVVFGNQDAAFPVIGLIGRKTDREWDSVELLRRFDVAPAELLEADPLLTSPKRLVVGLLDGQKLAEVKRLNTLDNLEIEISAGNFWILKDLRPDRPRVFESEFLKGNNLREFVARLKGLTKRLPTAKSQ